MKNSNKYLRPRHSQARSQAQAHSEVFVLRSLRLSFVVLVVFLCALTSFVLVSGALPNEELRAASALTVTPGVSTDPTGVLVTLDARGTWHEATSTSSGTGSSGCLRTWVKAFVPVYLDRGGPLWGGRHPMPRAPTPAHVAYHVYCGGIYVTSIWVLPTAFQATPPNARSLALQIVARLRYPALTITANPAHRGLAGLNTLFATNGFSGAPIRDSVRGFGANVEVEATPSAVSWQTGDGSTPRRVPFASGTRGLITHLYERRSPAPGYTVIASIELAIRWRLNAGAWSGLSPISRSASMTYPVIASRSRLIRSP